MAGSTVGTNQHYVPQALLRGFLSDEAREQLQAFDKHTRRQFSTTIRNVAAERDFYTLDGSDVLDTAMNRADDWIAPILRQLRDTRNLRRLSQEQIAILAGFTALQMIRTRSVLEQWRDIGIQLAARMEELGGSLSPEIAAAVDPERQREMFLSAIPRQSGDFMKHLLNKSILLFESDGALPFWIADNPVAKNNTLNPGDGIVGTLGLAVKGIEIYLPISSTLTVAFMCPTIAASHAELGERMRRMGFISLKAHEYLYALRTGRPMRLTFENVRFQNSLQVMNAERFVFSSGNDFRDASEMIAANEEVASGPRAQVR